MAEYRETLETEGFLIVSPVTGSMRPMIREQRDSVLMEPYRGVLHSGDVVLFHRGNSIVLHRAIHPIEGGWFTRGDHSYHGESTPEEMLIGVMRGFYRGESYIPANSLFYRLYIFWAVRMHPLRVRFWKLRSRIRRRFKGSQPDGPNI